MCDLDWCHRNFVMFENFFVFIEAYNWCVDINEEKIENMFEHANSLEMFCAKLKEKNLSEIFFEKLNSYFKSCGRISHLKFDFFLKACDVLLSKFLTDSRINDKMVRLSIKEYLKYCNEINRLHTVINQFVNIASAFLVLNDVATTECEPINIEARFIYESLCKRLDSSLGDVKSLDEPIMKMLMSNDKAINTLLHLLSFKDDDKICRTVKNCILSRLESCSSVDCIQIWQCFVKLPTENIKFIIKNCPDILDSIFSVISNVSKCFNCVYVENNIELVTNAEKSMTLSEVGNLLNILYSMNGIPKERTQNYLNSKKASPQYIFFEEIENRFVKSFNSVS